MSALLQALSRLSTRTRLVALVGLATLFVCLGTLERLREQLVLGQPLQTASAPLGLVSLQLSTGPAMAATILREWSARALAYRLEAGGRACDAPPARRTDPVLCAARLALERERGFINWYVALGLIAGLLILTTLGPSTPGAWSATLAIWLATLATALFDVLENVWIGALVAGLAVPAEGHVIVMRTFAQAKFLCLLGAGVFLSLGVCTAFRRWWDPGGLGTALTRAPQDAGSDARSRFRKLAIEEARGVGIADSDTIAREGAIGMGPAGEPWVAFRSGDPVGIALSGGGIRSATFNLGLLQGLDHLGLLRHIDYLTTVSGGGYIGGFWSAWFSRRPRRPEERFPAAPGEPAAGRIEPKEADEVRHVREFSRFLSPRIGFFETEMWHAIVAFLGGLLPTVAATLALMTLAIVCWLALTFPLAYRHPLAASLTIVLVTWTTFEVLERNWRRTADPEMRKEGVSFNRRIGLAALVLVGIAQYVWPSILEAGLGVRLPMLDPLGHWQDAPGPTAYEAWWNGVMGVPPVSTLYIFLRLFDFPIVWLLVAAVGLGARIVMPLLLLGRGTKVIALTSLDRVLMRLLGLALFWGAVAFLWHAGVNLTGQLVWKVGAGAVVSGGTFAILRNWLGLVFRRTSAAGLVERAKPYLPQILAYLTILLGICWLIALLVRSLDHDWWRWYAATSVAALTVASMLLLDPSEFSLHAFYRDRICRAYLGATNPDSPEATSNRNSELRPKDDVLISMMPSRPLHLVCCAANDLRGDQVGTLSRGSRSATLSRHGVAIGGYYARVPRLTLGTALTASAAAFNPAMGSVSKKLGPAVTFLMGALNLRLGYWVRHPASSQPRGHVFPGVLFFKELFGNTYAGNGEEASRLPSSDVHLSDGGHFENLGLYELVRRHCRYILVSDCGEDPEVAFDDFGNAARRIREDFGVEIEIDIAPVSRDASNRSQQHVAVGTVHYDRRYDKGILVYIKPTLTGDESPDVLQYHTRNPAFPHEGTIDQFFDEAQWESYRRLGVHCALSAFRFVERLRGRETETRATVCTADQVFTGIRREWHPTPPGLEARVLEMTERFGTLEAELRATRNTPLLFELFPEVQSRTQADTPETAASTPEQELATVAMLMRAVQLMEDVWMACGLDSQWNHPLNLGWTNAFARWATAPSLQMWWPVLSPMYGPGFQRFMRERFPALDRAWTGRVIAHPATGSFATSLPDGLATRWWRERMREDIDPTGRRVYQHQLRLKRRATSVTMQVGLVVVSSHIVDDRIVALWTNEDFFVPPSLWGAGLGGAFLTSLLHTLTEDGYAGCEVFIVNRDYEVGRGQRSERLGFVEFYRSAGFELVAKGGGESAPDELQNVLRPVPGRHGGLRLDAWARMRKTLR